MHQVRQRGWILPAYKLPKNAESFQINQYPYLLFLTVLDMHILRVVVREIHSEDMIECLVTDILWAYEVLRDRVQRAKHGLTRGTSFSSQFPTTLYLIFLELTAGVINLNAESVANMVSDTETFSRTC